MSTEIDRKENGCYNISSTRFYGGQKKGVMVQITIGDGDQTMCIALPKRQAIDFCAKTIASLNEVG
jgi:hypothetical protein